MNKYFQKMYKSISKQLPNFRYISINWEKGLYYNFKLIYSEKEICNCKWKFKSLYIMTINKIVVYLNNNCKALTIKEQDFIYKNYKYCGISILNRILCALLNEDYKNEIESYLLLHKLNNYPTKASIALSHCIHLSALYWLKNNS